MTLSAQDLLRGVFRDRADVVNADDSEYSDAGSVDPFEEVVIGDNPFHATGRETAPWDPCWEVGKMIGSGRSADVYELFAVWHPADAQAKYALKLSFGVSAKLCKREADISLRHAVSAW